VAENSTAGTFGVGEELVAVADERAAGRAELEAHAAGAVVDHVGHATFAHAQFFGDDAGVAFFAVDEAVLNGLAPSSADLGDQ